MRIALDAMGGDRAPRVTVEGAVKAANEWSQDIILVGPEDLLQRELRRCKVKAGRLEIVHAAEVVGMEESPAVAIRRKRNSSISVAVELVKSGRADALVSAGNTGAAVCAATLKLNLLQGIERPGIGIFMPTVKEDCFFIDAGANIEAKPKHLLQYAIMGEVVSRRVLQKSNPRIGLLNIGEERSKGTGFHKDAYTLLEESELNFVGNVEGKDLFEGNCDVVVCDGFLGNVILKVSESLAETVAEFLKQELKANLLTKFGALLSKLAFSRLRRRLDYAEYGGAPLLGIDGICIIGHGKSSAKAVKNALRLCGEFSRYHINQEIVKKLA